ncbi:hypothetical protein HMPREF0352_1692 [Enterococcus faecium TX1330]|nr:hypothetical protein HMPREF0352_1692 [Enterococcus faecium TX1330]
MIKSTLKNRFFYIDQETEKINKKKRKKDWKNDQSFFSFLGSENQSIYL